MQRERSLSERVKMSMFEGITVPMMLYGCKAWAMDKDVWRRVDVLESIRHDVV